VLKTVGFKYGNRNFSKLLYEHKVQKDNIYFKYRLYVFFFFVKM